MNRTRIEGTLCAIAAAVIFGFTPVMANLTFHMGSNPETLTFYRNFFQYQYYL